MWVYNAWGSILLSYLRNWKHVVLTIVLSILAINQIVFTHILTEPPKGRVTFEFCHQLPDGKKAIMIGDVVYDVDNAMKRLEEAGYMSMISEMLDAIKAYVTYSDALTKLRPDSFVILSFKQGNGVNNELVASTPIILGSNIRNMSETIDPHELIFELRLNVKRIKLP